MNKLSKDYFFILISLSVLVAIAWGYLIAMDNEMNVFDKFYFFTMPMTGNWTINDFIVMGIMWLVMMRWLNLLDLLIQKIPLRPYVYLEIVVIKTFKM